MSESHFSLLELPVFLIGVGVYSALLKLVAKLYRPPIELAWQHAAVCVLLFYAAKLFLFQLSAGLARALAQSSSPPYWIAASVISATLILLLGAWYLGLSASYQSASYQSPSPHQHPQANESSPSHQTNPEPRRVSYKDGMVLGLLLYLSMLLLGSLANYLHGLLR